MGAETVNGGELTQVRVIEYTIAPPSRFVGVNWEELWRFRELFLAFAWRDLAIRYKQTALGVLWAIIRPVVATVVFTVIFNRLAHVPSADGIPYPIFVYVGLLFWQYYTDVVTNASLSLVQSAPVLQKVYFPRLIVPAAAAITALVDAGIGAAVLVVMMAYYGYYPHLAGLLVLPVLLVGAILASLGVGLIFAALNTKYRDVRHALPFVTEILKYVTPVIYPATLLDSHPTARWLMLWLNPIAGIITEARNGLLGTGALNWSTIGIVLLTSTAIFSAALVYFRSTERYIADVI
jgi:lipopolysaccharide transport system permease protein